MSPAITLPSSDRFEALFEAEVDYVARTLRRLGVADADIEDLCHDTFLVVHRKLEQYDASRPVRPWLFGITYRVAVGHKRLFRHRFETTDIASIDPPSPDVTRQIEARDLVLRALAALPVERRAVLVLHDIDGQPAPEVGRALDIPVNTVYSRLRLARQEFKAEVERVEPPNSQEGAA